MKTLLQQLKLIIMIQPVESFLREHLIALDTLADSVRDALAEFERSRPKIGMNIGGVVDFDDGYQVFANVFDNANWVKLWNDRKAGKPSIGPVDGAKAIMLFREGEYELKAQLGVDEIVFVEFPNTPPIRLARRQVEHLKLAGDLAVKIKNENVGALEIEIRNVENKDPLFNDNFLAASKPFEILRDLNWSRINGSPRTDRLGLTHDGSPTWGASLNKFLTLCEACNADAYVLIPHAASEDYIKRMAFDCREWHERTQKEVYAAYSNELWNTARSFREQRIWVLSNQKDNETSEQTIGRVCAERLSWFTDEFENANMVLEWQAAANPKRSIEVMQSFTDTYGSPPDCWAIAPYLHCEFIVDGPVEASFMDRAARVALPKSRRWMDTNKDIADQYQCELIAYEGGQHFLPSDPKVADLTIRIQRTEAMQKLYAAYWDNWIEAGGSHHCFLGHIQKPRIKTGASFGAMEHDTDFQAPKWKALMQMLDDN